MPLDLVSLLDFVVVILFFGVAGAAAFRGLQLGRVFVNREYRSLANLMALLSIVVLVIGALVYSTLYLGAPDATATIDRINVGVAIVLFVFLDRIALVVMEADFFHRDTLNWRKVRKAVYVSFIGFLGAGYFLTYVVMLRDTIGPLYALFLTYFGYLAAVIVVSGQRASDVTVKTFVRALSLSFIFLVAGAAFNNPSLRIWIVHDGLSLIWGYIYYRAVMTLSPVGRVRASAVSEKDMALLFSSKSKVE